MHVLRENLWWVIVGAIVIYSVWERIARKRRAERRRTEAPAPVRAYGFDERIRTVELGVVSLTRGLELLDERYAFADYGFDSAEEAMAKTVIGFCRDDEHFIEINVIGASLINVRAGVGVTEKGDEQQVDIGDIEALRALVRAYFDRPRNFADYWRSLEGRKRAP